MFHERLHSIERDIQLGIAVRSCEVSISMRLSRKLLCLCYVAESVVNGRAETLSCAVQLPLYLAWAQSAFQNILLTPGSTAAVFSHQSAPYLITHPSPWVWGASSLDYSITPPPPRNVQPNSHSAASVFTQPEQLFSPYPIIQSYSDHQKCQLLTIKTSGVQVISS